MYKYDSRLPAITAVALFAVDTIICLLFLPDYHTKSDCKTASTEAPKSKMSFFRDIRSILSLPITGSLLLFRLLLIFVESSMNANNILNYFESKFGIETYQRGFLSSVVSVTSLIVDALMVAPVMRLVHHGRGGERIVVYLCILVMALAAFAEYLIGNFYIYVLLCLLPTVVSSSLLSSASKAIFLNSVLKPNTGKAIGVLGLLSSGVGVFTPIYGSQLFGFLDGLRYKGLIAGCHFIALEICCFVLLRGLRPIFVDELPPHEE